MPTLFKPSPRKPLGCARSSASRPACGRGHTAGIGRPGWLRQLGTTNGRVAAYGWPIITLDKSVPRPSRDVQPVRDSVCGPVVSGHCGQGRPGEVVVQHLSAPVVAGETDVDQCLIKAGDRTTVHLLVRTVAAMQPHLRGFVAVAMTPGVRRLGASSRVSPGGWRRRSPSSRCAGRRMRTGHTRCRTQPLRPRRFGSTTTTHSHLIPAEEHLKVIVSWQ
jgi:hypothetical protein